MMQALSQARYGIGAVVVVGLVFAVGALTTPNLTFRIAYAVSFVVLAAIGLAIIFGIMGVINLAHGEFILVGAYATTLAVTKVGLPLPVAMVAGALVTAGFGLVVERVIISGYVPNWIGQRTVGRDLITPFYDRLADSMVATFGLSLIMVQGARIVFGNSIDQIGVPFGSTAGYPDYRIALVGITAGVLALVYVLFTQTLFGTRVRATMQDEQTAKALGIDTERTYMYTFAIGSGLAGFTGALFAPLLSMQPSIGDQFLVEAFVAVVVGGASVVVGTSLSGLLLGPIDALFSDEFGEFAGRIALLVTAMLALRFLPGGITGLIDRVRAMREGGS
ncbi:amino acid/amide ABC transporter membrane protein 1, HAAT family [Halomicrobium zhouii]|uniref:Amino acid/amide ABC transporter membrane protein 1, HAAT family n=1 Tax=Halomicrobium zhouii TaxID=767519 RepID=A0A1I6K7F9_9EURY|nr:urea ABC transporter, permease protein UrtB [Halomicrobium zhouii]SFR87173.1 amino acid/amide ABC transporter membrane protein 1, HAAT family [Halomicrobium zhouii]